MIIFIYFENESDKSAFKNLNFSWKSNTFHVKLHGRDKLKMPIQDIIQDYISEEDLKVQIY